MTEKCVLSLIRSTERSSTTFRAFHRAFSSSRAYQQRFAVASLLRHNDEINTVEIAGWVRTVRKQKRVAFVALEDGSTIDSLQAVLNPEQGDGLAHGTSVRLQGSWIKSSGKDQNNELRVTAVEICGNNDAENNPIQPKYQSNDFLRTVPHLRPRTAGNALLLRFRSEVIASITKWFHGQRFVQCHTPVITSSDCEGAGEVFTVSSSEELAVAAQQGAGRVQPFFRTPKYLTVSAQLHLEALAQAVSRVWTLSPTFRAEKSDTPRHLSEFYMLEAELCFTRSVDEVMDVVEDMLRTLATKLQSSDVYHELIHLRRKPQADAGEISATALEGRWAGLAAASWPRITYAEAIEILTRAHESRDHEFIIPPSQYDGLAAEHERYIADVVGRGSPVFVTHYPTEQKPFYMAPGDRDSVVACFDLLVPDLCELVGGSLREHRLDKLLQGMASKGVAGDGLEWYQDLRRYGSVPHGGFGLGFDRLLCYLTGTSSVRDMVSFPRYFGRADC